MQPSKASAMTTTTTLSITRRLNSALRGCAWLCAALALNLPPVNAATVVTGPGALVEGTDEFGEPLSGSATFQYIIPASALVAFQNQTITGLAFRADSDWDPVAPAYGFANLKISMGSTALADLSGASTTFAANNAGATTTYNGAFYYTNPLPGGGAPNAFGDFIYFTTPYAYTTGNLIVTISHTTHVKQTDGSAATYPGIADAYVNVGGVIFENAADAAIATRSADVSPVTALTTSAPPPRPTLQVTPDTTNYLAAGGTVSYEISLAYPATPSALGLRVVTPADWTYTATTGTNAPVCLDAVGAKQGNSDEGFGWFYFTAPATPAKFTVKLTYPPGQTGDKSVSFTGLYHDSTGPVVSLTPVAAVPALLPPPTAPTITTQPVATTTVLAGSSVTLTVVASGTNPVTYQWRKAGKDIADATMASYMIGITTTADSGDYTVVVTNPKGSVTSAIAKLTVAEPPKVTTQPKDITGLPGGTIVLTAAATSAAPVAYQWYFNNSPISGATQATYTVVGATGATTGYYYVMVTSSVDSQGVKSSEARVQIAPAGTSATHLVVSTPGRGYTAGSTCRITNTIAFPTTATAVAWTVLLPTGFSLASDTSTASSKPAVGTITRLDWAWDAGSVTSPITFTYTLNVPANASGIKAIGGLAYVRINNENLPILGTPDPLAMAQAGLPHSTDTDGDWRISTDELAQTIALFNTTYNNVRTGAYKYLSSGATGGFALDPSGAVGVPDLAHIHSADINADGMIDLKEILQLIDLYNYRVGTERTGHYHWQVDEAGLSVDKYATGP